MTKKTEVKGVVKGADAEQKVLKKIQDGNKAAEKTVKKDGKDKKDFASFKAKENKGEPSKLLGKRTYPKKEGEVSEAKPKYGETKATTKDGAQPFMNRRQKQKVSDLIKKLRISYNRLLMKKKEMSGEEKHAVVQECIDAIGEKYPELCYKHDGCRVL